MLIEETKISMCCFVVVCQSNDKVSQDFKVITAYVTEIEISVNVNT